MHFAVLFCKKEDLSAVCLRRHPNGLSGMLDECDSFRVVYKYGAFSAGFHFFFGEIEAFMAGSVVGFDDMRLKSFSICADLFVFFRECVVGRTALKTDASNASELHAAPIS